MADVQIQKALEAHLAAMQPPLPTVWQNRAPVAGATDGAHQKAFLMPNANKSYGLREKTTLHSGIFQVNLCYPSGTGAAQVTARGVMLQEHFKGQVLEVDGVKVQIRGKPSIAAPISIAPYTVPVTIRYLSIN